MNYFSDWTYEDVKKHNMKIKDPIGRGRGDVYV